MTAAELALWNRVQRRAAAAQPEFARAILQAFSVIRDRLTDAELERAIALGGVERLVAVVMEQAMHEAVYQPLRERMRGNLNRSVRYFARDLPRGGRIDGQLAVGFDILSPKVIEGVRGLESRVITTLRENVRESVRAYVENGLRDGASPKAVARQIRSIIGLAPNQEEAVRNFRLALEGNGRNPLDYKLRDRRFDALIRKGDLSPEKIDRMVDAYRRKMLAFNANTNATTAALDAQKLAQRMAWQDAQAKGIVGAGDLVKVWRGVMDDRERDEHVAMEGETVPFDAPFSNGEMTPGESTYNCRCVAIVKVRPAA